VKKITFMKRTLFITMLISLVIPLLLVPSTLSQTSAEISLKTYTFEETNSDGDFFVTVTLNNTWQMGTIQRVYFGMNFKNDNYNSIYVRTLEAGFTPVLNGKFVINTFLEYQENETENTFFIMEFYVDKSIWGNQDSDQLFSFSIDGWVETKLPWIGFYDSSPMHIFESWTIHISQSQLQYSLPYAGAPTLKTWELREQADYFPEYLITIRANDTWTVGTEQTATITISPQHRFGGYGGYMKIGQCPILYLLITRWNNRIHAMSRHV
jgi:hypothetical protein